MRNSRTKVGLLGAGYIVEAHATALKTTPGVETVAVCDRARDRAEEAGRRFGIPQVFTSLEQMLESDIDVVHVLLPPDLHIDATRQILESGRHAFIEKPMGLSSVECQALVDLARQRGVKLGVNHNFLFLPSYERLRSDVRDGTIGRLDQVTINWLYLLALIQFGPYNNWMLREPRNLFFELGPHLVAFALDLVGPFDRLATDVFRPIDLPGGSRVWRRWHVHGLHGDTSIDLNLSVTPGFTDRSIVVRGHAASARCDFDRDLYVRDEPSGHDLLLDNFATARSMASQLGRTAVANLIKSVRHTLAKSPAANPFGESIQRSVGAFHGTLGGTLDPRVDGSFGVQVITTCERIVQAATFEAPPADARRVWAVLPPQKPATVLVVGGTGFIGSCLVRRLVERGLGVRVPTRGLSAANIVLAGLPIDLVQGELSDAAFVDRALEGIDIVYYLAKANGAKWDDYYRNDVLVTKHVAERARLRGVKRFIYTGTIDSYYSARESDVLTADTPLDTDPHRNHYARSKAACENLLMAMHRDSGFPVVIFRPGVVIGRGSPPAHWGVGMFQSETRVQLWGSGRTKLPLVLVEDVADALVLALDKQGLEGQTFLLTDEALLSARDYVEEVSRASGTRLRAEPTPIWKFFLGDAFKELLKHAIGHPNRRVPSYRDWDSRSHRARYDSTKTREVLGWHPAGTREALIERGIRAAVDDFMR